MPVKCPFCRRKYVRSGPYEKHLRTAHEDLDIVLATTIRHTGVENPVDKSTTHLSQHQYPEHPGDNLVQDSDYESDPDPMACEPIAIDPDAASDSDTSALDCSNGGDGPMPIDVTYYPRAGDPMDDVSGFEEEVKHLCEHPWAPFSSAHDFKLATWFIQSKVAKSRINDYFSNGLGNSADVGYSSMHTLENHLRLLDPFSPYLRWTEGHVDDGKRSLPFYFRNILHCVRYLLRQMAYREDLVYAPRREYDANGQRIYSEMNTADWWWDMQDTLPTGATVVPIIGMSDQTHLSNFSGDKKAWPVYITIGNLVSARRNKPGSMAVILLALLPVPPKFAQSSSADQLQREINAETLHTVFQLIFEPLKDAARDGVPVDCADGKIRNCFPILAAWIADHMENVALHGIKANACPKCEVPANDLGSNGKTPYPKRDYERYERLKMELTTNNCQKRKEKLNDIGLSLGQNIFHGLERVSAPDLYKPDLLHTIYLGIFKHLMLWIQQFLKKHSRLDAFDDVWKALPPYPGFFVPKKAYREVTQWQGKEMRNLGRCLLGVLAVSLTQPESTQIVPFKRALLCVRSLIDFTLMAHYRSHTLETIEYMDQYLAEFHRTKDIFLEFRVSKRTTGKVQDQTRALRQLRTEADKTLRKSQQRRIQEQYRAEENDQRLELIQKESHFNFIKMHFLSHFQDHIQQFGNVQMYSTDISEIAHKEQIKEGWRRSNKIDPMRQILHSYSRQHSIRMRLLNLDAVRRRGGDLPKEVVDLLDTTPKQATGRRVLKGRRADVSSVTDLCKVLGIPWDTFCRGLEKYSRNTLPIESRLPADLETLRLLPIEHLTQLEIPIPAFQETDEYDIHRARSTGDREFRNQGIRQDWVWVQVGGEHMYGALRGRLPGKLMALIKIRDVTHFDRVHRLAVVQMLSAVNGGRLSDIHGLATVQLPVRDVGRDFIIIDIGTILGLAHLIPESDHRWLVNSRIDLRTFNEIY